MNARASELVHASARWTFVVITVDTYDVVCAPGTECTGGVARPPNTTLARYAST